MIVPGCDDISQGLVISDNPSDTEIDDANIVAEGNQFVWIPVTNEEDYVRNLTYIHVTISETAYTDTGYLPEGIQNSTDDSIINEETEKEAVLNSGGFYISRYEAGKEGESTLISKKGATVWNNISHEDSKRTAKTFINNENVKSALCSGIQWDVTMSFITENDKEYDVTISDNNRHTGVLAASGTNLSDKVCNIYDLEGNCREFVAEKTSYHNDGRIFVDRGGEGIKDDSTVDYNSASNRGAYFGRESGWKTFRFVLYVM